jgi:hypothetical protein
MKITVLNPIPQTLREHLLYERHCTQHLNKKDIHTVLYVSIKCEILAKYEKYAANKAKPWMSTETNEVGGG